MQCINRMALWVNNHRTATLMVMDLWPVIGDVEEVDFRLYVKISENRRYARSGNKNNHLYMF